MKNALEIPLLLVAVTGVLVIANWPTLTGRAAERRRVAIALEAPVRQEINSLSGSQELLRSLRLGPVAGTYVAGRDVSMTGYFQFDGVYANQSCRVFVTWHRADTNAPIDRIEIGGAAKELRTIWSRKRMGDAL
jgi:hypothetical protein